MCMYMTAFCMHMSVYGQHECYVCGVTGHTHNTLFYECVTLDQWGRVSVCIRMHMCVRAYVFFLAWADVNEPRVSVCWIQSE